MEDDGSNLVMKLTMGNIVSRCGFLMFLGQ